MNRVVVYTDGACSGNPGPGGWAWATEDGRSDFGQVRGNTTNNRMELKAAIEALKAIPDHSIEIRTDSKYVADAFPFRKWYQRKNPPFSNRDLWEQLIELVRDRNVYWTHVRGHSGDPMNMKVDRLARNAIERR